MTTNTCKPGGCGGIGCEGGFYCFNADGTPRPDPAPVDLSFLYTSVPSTVPDSTKDEQ